MISVEGLSVSFGTSAVLAGIDLKVDRAEVVALTGPSGTGKTSLLNCVSGLRRPREGSVTVDGERLHEMSTAARCDFRRRRTGLLFQTPDLLEELSVVENVAFMQIFDGTPRATALRRAEECLADVGLAGHESKRIDEVSGGEAQRVALARALAKPDMAVFIADEPTASLDAATAVRITELLVGLCRERGVSLLLATHDREVAGRCDRVVWLPDLNRAGERLPC